MPYIILTANGEEIERRELTSGALVIGRSPESDVPVRDILLSRKHCRVEPGTGKDKGRWRLVDLNSRNGSHVNWKKITQHRLFDGDAVRIGRTWLTFKAGAYAPAAQAAQDTPVRSRKDKLIRPSDPHEALRGTVADFIYVEPDGVGQDFDGTPSPPRRPSEAAPAKSVSSSLDQLSSSWESIVATAARPKRMARPIPRSNDAGAYARKPSETSLSLQADAMHMPFLEVVPPLVRRRGRIVPALILTTGIGLATLVVLVSGWLMARG